MSSLLNELKRRNVIRVSVAYIIVGWLLLQVASVIFPTFEAPAWVMKAVTAVILLGFPLVVLFAWAFEITPEGLKKTKAVEPETSITQTTGRKLDTMIIATLAIAVAFLLWDRFVPAGVETGEVAEGEPTVQVAEAGTSIAVLPFVNMSADPDQEYFSDGISEELLNVLAKIPDLRVAARTSSFQFKGDNLDIAEIGRKLNVGHVLEGSVRKAGTRLRITAQLIDAENGFHMWSETYDRELTDIFAIQDEISQAIVAALQDRLGLESVEGVAASVAVAATTDAYDEFLFANALIRQRTRANIENAVEHYQAAIELDDTYAPAHAGLGLGWLLLGDRPGSYGELTDEETLRLATPPLERALELDPGLAEAHANNGLMLNIKGELEEALAAYDRAIAINPNMAVAHNWRATLLGEEMGRYREAMEAIERAYELDPMSVISTFNYGLNLLRFGREEESRTAFLRTGEIDPAFGAIGLSIHAILAGNLAEAENLTLAALAREPENRRLKGRSINGLANLRLIEEARSSANENDLPGVYANAREWDAFVTHFENRLAEDPDNTNLAVALAMGHMAMGELSRARPALERAWRQFGGRVSLQGTIGFNEAFALYQARTAAGDVDGATEIMAAVKAEIANRQQQGLAPTTHTMAEARVAAIEGRLDEVMSLLEARFETNFLDRFLDMPPEFAPLRENPRFTRLQQQIQMKVGEERGKFLIPVCRENPFAGVWQPTPETCSGVSNPS